jgi:hypothetical protein
MPATYNGSATGIAARQQVDMSEMIDTDVRNAASVQTPLRRLANFLQWLMQNVALKASPTWTTIASNADRTAANGLAYCKDDFGFLHMKGKMTWIGNTNGNFFQFPAGYRPQSDVDLIAYGSQGAQIVAVSVSIQASTGGIFFGAAQGQGASPYTTCPIDMTNVSFYAG